VLVVAAAGRLAGRAPLFERFTLGNSATLRGWNKFDVAPLGGERMAHATLEYRFKSFQVFYDAGSVWDRGRQAVAKHSAGFGIREDKGAARLVMPGFFATVAFPIRSGRAAPMFMVGVNF
jgi:outer membrane protein assembly factor BamA